MTRVICAFLFWLPYFGFSQITKLDTTKVDLLFVRQLSENREYPLETYIFTDAFVKHAAEIGSDLSSYCAGRTYIFEEYLENRVKMMFADGSGLVAPPNSNLGISSIHGLTEYRSRHSRNRYEICLMRAQVISADVPTGWFLKYFPGEGIFDQSIPQLRFYFVSRIIDLSLVPDLSEFGFTPVNKAKRRSRR